ncbi:MFS transporter [Paenibacillus sp. IB182496]|uniref:MFS transporter n=1 Tax=Paenibacillus sabuli TaxID=2772509 RepID=A0A927GQW9_9BACL|nr:MFS transporter [Paenibacillus sabuli]MBD2844979.1 MFS transporter [Paenibacillus sabuli]
MWILWAGVLLCSASYTMAVPFLPLFLLELGVGDDAVNLWAGAVHASAFLVGALMAPLWGSLADKYGKRKMVIRAGLSLAIIYGLIAFVHNPWELIGVRMLHGLVGGFVPASMAIVASIAPKEQIGWSLGMMQAGTMTGGIMGPLFGGLLANAFGQRLSFIIAAACILIATLAVIGWVKEGVQRSPAKRSRIIEDVRVVLQSGALTRLLLLLLLFQLAINMIQPLLTLHIAHLQGDVKGAVLSSGFVFALIGVAGIIASPTWGRIGARRGYMPILAACFAAAGATVSLQFFVQELWLFTVVQFVFGLFMAGIVPNINTLVVQHTDEAFRGRSFGLTTSANQLGAMIGPLIGGALGYFLSIGWIFVTTGLLLLAGGLAVWTNLRPVVAQGDTASPSLKAESISFRE